MDLNNPDEFALFVEASHHIVLSAVKKYLFAEYYSSIDDAVQETYIRAYKGLSSGQLLDETKLNSWLYVIAKNESIRINKKFLKNKDIEKKYSEYIEEEEGIIVERENDLRLLVEIKQKADEIPKKYNEVFNLFLDGKNENAISNELKIPKGTVKSRLHRAKAFIGKFFSKEI